MNITLWCPCPPLGTVSYSPVASGGVPRGRAPLAKVLAPCSRLILLVGHHEQNMVPPLQISCPPSKWTHPTGPVTYICLLSLSSMWGCRTTHDRTRCSCSSRSTGDWSCLSSSFQSTAASQTLTFSRDWGGSVEKVYWRQPRPSERGSSVVEPILVEITLSLSLTYQLCGRKIALTCWYFSPPEALFLFEWKILTDQKVTGITIHTTTKTSHLANYHPLKDY